MTKSKLQSAIDLTKEEDYLQALILFTDVYSEQETPQVTSTAAARGLSYYGLCVALVQKKYKQAIELAKRAVELQFYTGEHYANLTRVYLAAGHRKKAVETLESGLKHDPENEELMEVRKLVGVRARPAVPFLDRAHPINVSLGHARHAKKSHEEPKKRK